MLVPGTIAGSLLPHQLLRDYGNLDVTATVPHKGTEIVLSISMEEALELAYDWLSQYFMNLSGPFLELMDTTLPEINSKLCLIPCRDDKTKQSLLHGDQSFYVFFHSNSLNFSILIGSYPIFKNTSQNNRPVTHPVSLHLQQTPLERCSTIQGTEE